MTKMLGNIAGQAAWVLPWLWLPLIWVLAKNVAAGPAPDWKNSLPDRTWFLCCLAMGPIVVFTIPTLWGSQGLFHWQAPGYLLAWPLLGRSIAGWLNRDRRQVLWWLKASVLAFLIIVSLLGSHTATGWMRLAAPRWFTHGDPTTEALDWRDLPGYLQQQNLLTGNIKGVIAPHWIDAGKIDYVLGGKIPVLCLTNEPHHFAFMHHQSEFKGSDMLIIGRRELLAKLLPGYRPYFTAIDPLGTVTITRQGFPEFEVSVFQAKEFTGTFPLP